MFFPRKPKNRRLGREQVLDVKLRSSQVRAARMRLLTITAGIVFVSLFVLYLLWRGGDWLLTKMVYENNAFTVQHLEVKTDGTLAVVQLCRWAGLQPSQNLLALDLGRVKRNLELVPLIRTVSVERVLPRTLRISVTERDSIAQVNLPRPRPGGGIEIVPFQLDPEGYVMLPLEGHRAGTNNPGGEILPSISGLDPRALQPGRRIDLPQLQAALQLLVAFEQSPMAGLIDLKSIDIGGQDLLLVKTGQASEISFGLNDPEQQWRRCRAIFDLAQRTGKAIATLDLAVTNSIPVCWQDPGAVPPGAPKLPRPLRAKKKHV